MTVIAWDGTTLATDSRATYGNQNTTVAKIWTVGNYAIAGCGTNPAYDELVHWAKMKCAKTPVDFPASAKDSGAAVVIADMQSKELTRYDSSEHGTLILDPLHAAGTGGDVALGAMASGASAQTAVRIAARFNCACGLPVQYVACTGATGKTLKVLQDI